LKIGPRLRAERKSRKTSLRALAKRTGFSASFLSQVELGQTSPSLASLQRICAALEVDLPDLFRSPGHEPESPVVRRAHRESLRSEWSKASAQSLLADGLDEGITALLLSLDPCGRTGALPLRKGWRGFAYCLRGKVTLSLGKERHQLGAGHSVLMTQPNASWENRGKTRVEVLLITARSS
jgi:transcriptional regulator with XRE-family HTH domain